MLKTLLVALLVLSLAGCATRIGDFTVISTQNVDFSKLAQVDLSTSQKIEGEDIKTFGQPSLEEAIDDALEKGGGNVLVNASLYIYQGFFRSGYQVKGDVVNAK